MKRSRIKPRSQKRIDEADARWEVRQATLQRAGFRCEAPDLAFGVPHGGPLDVDERISRGVRPGAHLDVTITQVLCRMHHSAKALYPDEARRLGLTFRSWEYEEAQRL